ncbi:MAG: asparaginase [Acidobacteriota bacterium]|nr:asparaginase [Acidobacteriota bacterium]
MSTERAFVTAGAALLAAATSAAQEIPPLPPPGIDLPHVVLVSVGGEIATGCETPLERVGCTSGGETFAPETWTRDLPDLGLAARIRTEDLRAFSRADGGAAPEHWFGLANRLRQLAEESEVDGVVVTHGADGLADTAFFLNLVLPTRKPVVLVAAQRPWSAVSGDGPLNLYDAVRVAADPAAAGNGVVVVANQEVHAARDARRTSAYRMDGFGSVDLGLIGVADPDIVRFFTEPTRRHTHRSEFELAALPEALPAVEIVAAVPDAPGRLIDASVAAGAKGLVVDGAGGLSGGQLEAVRRAHDQGIVVVATSATRGGRVPETSALRESGIIPGDNLTPGKARTLLRLALTRTSDPTEIRRFFAEY